MAHSLHVSASRKGAFLSSCVLASAKRRSAVDTAGFGTRSIIETISAGADTDLVENAALNIIDQCLTGTGDHHALIDDIRSIALSVQKSDSIDTPIHDCSLSTINWLTEQHLSAPALPPKGYAPTEPPISWISKWFESEATIKVVDRLDADIGLRRSWLIVNLDELRDRGPSLWQLIVSGQFSEALRQNAKTAILSIEDMRELVRQQALFFYYVDIVLKGHLIRRWNTAPLGDTMPVDCDWPMMASVMESHIIVPAQQISATMAGLHTNICQRPGTTTSPLSEVPSWLRDPRLIAIAERIQSRLIGGRARSSSFAKVAASLVAELSSVTSLSRSTLSKQGLGRREFVMERIGVTGSESSVILAMALLNAKARIDICIDAALSNQAVTGHFELNYHAVGHWNGAVSAEKSKISSRALVRTSMFLRRHLAMDRHHAERSCGFENTNAGRAMVDAARKKFRCVHPGDAITVLVHDPALWLA
ncbi:hypothetical protein [Sphingomonas faeni]|uniref:hypothetical protein n=1 Tax=Sphingomonas faeni TaxID=185950 RepID=UPI00334F7750